MKFLSAFFCLALLSGSIFAEPTPKKCPCTKCECTYESNCGCLTEKTNESSPKKISSVAQGVKSEANSQ